jgi:hypothetical protein
MQFAYFACSQWVQQWLAARPEQFVSDQNVDV